MLYTARGAGSMASANRRAFVSIRLYSAAIVRATREAGILDGAMGSQEEIWLKRGAPRAFALLPAVALSISLLLAPGAVSQADDSLPAGDSAGSGDQSQSDVRKIIAEAETPDIQRDPPAQKPPASIPRLPRIHFDLSWLPYAILVLIAAGLVFVAARYIRYRTGLHAADLDQPPEPGTATYALALDEAERDHTFDEVDQLAAQGAFSEAIHRLLLLVQERLRSRIEHGFQSSLTSREILRRAKLAGEPKTAFASLVAAVEITLFGQQAANLATYQLCRDNSRRVLAATA
jgi:hypothetical protein